MVRGYKGLGGIDNLMKSPDILLLIVVSMAFAGCVGGPRTSTTETASSTTETAFKTSTTGTTIGEGPATPASTTVPYSGGAANLATVNAIVIDKGTKRPLEGVLVFIGTGDRECLTVKFGTCSIEDFVWGSYSLNAFKRGYVHYTNSTYFGRGENVVTIELEGLPQPQESLTVEGKVFVDVVAKGSRSENRYLKVRTAGGDYYLFNKYGKNGGAGDYEGKTVRITGYGGTGSIGWQGQDVEGIYVEGIIAV
jgi:hypothetical protein